METTNQTQDSGEYKAPEKKKNYFINLIRKPGIEIIFLITVILFYLIIYNIRKPHEQGETYQSSEVDKAPECTNLAAVRSTIKYPPAALESGEDGTVLAAVLVGTNGKVIMIGSLTGPEVFYHEVKDKAKNLEFTPGIVNGIPVKVWVTVPFHFKLKN